MLSGGAPPPRTLASRGRSAGTHMLLRAVPLSLCRAAAAAAAAASDGSGSAAPGPRRRRRATTVSSSSGAVVPPQPHEAGAPSSYSTTAAPAAEEATRARSKSRGGTTSTKRQRPSSPATAPPPPAAGVEFGPQPDVPGLEAARAWVVFSDLHVSHASLGTALEVLQRVHQEARQRQAGVLFLGDFWDRRGDLPVVPLNRILRELRSWGDTPLLMLPGNHCQVDLGGTHHSLEPLAVAAQAAHVFTQPTLYKHSLWLPYRRDEGAIRAAIEAAVQQGPLKAIFGHADVLTAHMNQAYQARDGLPPGLFPQRVPVFMGHYHYPHTVPGTAITYVGSPYQVTSSEAGQQKRLLLLDTDWQQVDSIPIDVGRRFFHLATPAAAAAAAASNGSAAAAATTSSSDAALLEPANVADSSSSGEGGPLLLDGAAVQRLVAGGSMRRGDVLHLKAEQGDAHEAQLADVLQLMSQQGVEVQLHRAPASRPAARIATAEQLSMAQLLELYASNTGMQDDVLATARAALKDLGARSSTAARHSHLQLDEVTVEGFGPFSSPVTYPLSGRGVVAVTGANRDDAAAVSNGAGKTSLLTSLLWAFKAPDGRKMTNADYINDASRTAKVCVRGCVNGEPFELTRTASKSKSSLSLVVGGADLTQQEQRLTEAELESRFSASLLPKTLVFTQEDLLGLLQSGDAGFKRALSAVVDTDCWDGARQAAGGHVSALGRQQDAAEGVAASLAASVQRLRGEVEAQQREAAAWGARQQEAQASAAASEQAALQQTAAAADEAQALLRQLQAALAAADERQVQLQEAAAAAFQAAENAAADAAAEADAPDAAAGQQQPPEQKRQQPQAAVLPEFDAATAAADLQPLLAAEQAASTQLQQQRGVAHELRGQLAAAEKRRAKYARLQQQPVHAHATSAAAVPPGSSSNPTDGQQQQRPPHVCEQCLQPINTTLYERNLAGMAAEQEQLQAQLAAAHAEEAGLAAALAAATSARTALQQQQQEQAAAVKAAREAVMAQVAAANAERARAAEQQRLAVQQRQREQQGRLQEAWREERQLQGELAAVRQLAQGLAAAQQQLTTSLSSAVQPCELSTAAGITQQQQQQQPEGPSPPGLPQLQSRASDLQARSQALTRALAGAVGSVAASRAKLQQLQVMSNPHTSGVQQLQRQLEQQQDELSGQQQQHASLARQAQLWRRVEAAFGRSGIPSFLLEGVLGELQAAASRHLAHLAAGMTLELSATSNRKAAASAGAGAELAAAPAAAAAGEGVADASARVLAAVAAAAAADGSAGGAAAPWDDLALSLPLRPATPSSTTAGSGDSADSDSDTEGGADAASSASKAGGAKKGGRRKTAGAAAVAPKEEIQKVIRVQGAGGRMMQRGVAQLSGGEKKRVALALGLGFAEVVAARGRLTSNVLILDEVLEKLDDEGCSRVAQLLKGLPLYDSVFVVGQANSFVVKEFAAVDTVVKAGGRSHVELGRDAA